MPNGIRRIAELIPEKVKDYYVRYPFEVYGAPVIRKKLALCNIRREQQEYQECYDAAMVGYLYSIHRCAWKNYDYVEAYIRKMVSVCIILGWNLAHEMQYLCHTNQLQHISLDDEVSLNKF